MTTVRPSVAVEPFRVFDVRVARVRRIGHSFARVTFAGPDLDRFADNGLDQRIKLVLPLPGLGVDPMPRGPGWPARWRALPEPLRNPLRTYTVRGVRPAQREVDLDMVLHGATGPASRFALHARSGDEAALVGPDASYDGRHGGVEFQVPTTCDRPLLFAADETALPALANILTSLPRACTGRTVIEVPHADDRLVLGAPDGVAVDWLVRGGRPHGALLVEAFLGAPSTGAGDAAGAAGDVSAAVDEDEEALLWDVATDVAAGSGGGCYAWLAGEATAIRTIRRHLVADLGHDRRAVSFMGYWRAGRPEV